VCAEESVREYVCACMYIFVFTCISACAYVRETVYERVHVNVSECACLTHMICPTFFCFGVAVCCSVCSVCCSVLRCVAVRRLDTRIQFVEEPQDALSLQCVAACSIIL